MPSKMINKFISIIIYNSLPFYCIPLNSQVFCTFAHLDTLLHFCAMASRKNFERRSSPKDLHGIREILHPPRQVVIVGLPEEPWLFH